MNSCYLFVELLFSGGSHIDLSLELDHLDLLIRSFLMPPSHILVLFKVLRVLSVSFFIDEHLNSAVNEMLKIALELR